MPLLHTERVSAYLRTLVGQDVRGVRVTPLAAPPGTSIKEFGYGTPLRIDFEAGGRPHTVVIETMSPGPFGHEHPSDRAQAMLWSHAAYNRLPRHVRSLDAGAFTRDGALLSLGAAEEFFVVMEFAEGRCYSGDLERMRDTGESTPLDTARADALCDYLIDIHRVHGTDPGLYVRRIRDVVGHGECIMGLADSYPPSYRGLLERIEKRCVEWRWRLKGRAHRLRQVHGDYHPWNVLFREATDFTVLDRSRGEWGEPADDVTCMSMNYLFFSLQRCGRLEGGFERLFRGFWDRYLAATGDREMLEAAAPFLAFRGLVMASPVWYPRLGETVRRRLFAFIENVLASPRFEPERANDYCEVSPCLQSG